MTTPSPSDPQALAEERFADFLDQGGATGALGFESWLAGEEEALRPALRRLHADWQRFGRLLAAAAPGAPPSGVPAVPEAESGQPRDPNPSAELLRRLGIGPGSSGRYRFRSLVMIGGQGVVLKVWDTELRRPLAMKVVLGKGEEAHTGHTPDLDQRALARFLDEAQITGQLDHPGIVPVHELGADSTGRAWFTMRLVKGQSFKEVIEAVHAGSGEWTRVRALGVLLKVCEAVAYAHSRGIVHRDLKPGNVMVGRYGEVYVMDWGLARVLGQADRKDLRLTTQPGSTGGVSTARGAREDDPDSPLFTMDGDVVGTPAYMPPEQARGEMERVGPRADVYAIGAMLYHLLAGHMPYVAPGTKASNYAVWRWVQEGPPEPLERRAPKAPAELVAICEKAMQRAAEQRYASPSELEGELRAYLEGRVVRAHRTGVVVEVQKWARRNRALAGTFALIALAGAAYAGWWWTRPGLIRVTTTHENTLVLLDGVEVARIAPGEPLTLNASPGPHSIRLEVPDLDLVTDDIAVVCERLQVFEVSQQPTSRFTTLTVETDPPGMRARLLPAGGGPALELQGRTPLTVPNALPGRHVLELELHGERRTEDLELDRGVPHHVRSAWDVGELLISPLQPGLTARVYSGREIADGALVAEAALAGETRMRIASGLCSIEITAAEGCDWLRLEGDRALTLLPGRTTRLDAWAPPVRAHPMQSPGIGPWDSPSDPLIFSSADLNNDGVEEIAISIETTQLAASAIWLRGIAGPTRSLSGPWEAGPSQLCLGYPAPLDASALLDLDGDGLSELIGFPGEAVFAMGPAFPAYVFSQDGRKLFAADIGFDRGIDRWVLPGVDGSPTILWGRAGMIAVYGGKQAWSWAPPSGSEIEVVQALEEPTGRRLIASIRQSERLRKGPAHEGGVSVQGFDAYGGPLSLPSSELDHMLLTAHSERTSAPARDGQGPLSQLGFDVDCWLHELPSEELVTAFLHPDGYFAFVDSRGERGRLAGLVRSLPRHPGWAIWSGEVIADLDGDEFVERISVEQGAGVLGKVTVYDRSGRRRATLGLADRELEPAILDVDGDDIAEAAILLENGAVECRGLGGRILFRGRLTSEHLTPGGLEVVERGNLVSDLLVAEWPRTEAETWDPARWLAPGGFQPPSIGPLAELVGGTRGLWGEDGNRSPLAWLLCRDDAGLADELPVGLVGKVLRSLGCVEWDGDLRLILVSAEPIRLDAALHGAQLQVRQRVESLDARSSEPVVLAEWEYRRTIELDGAGWIPANVSHELERATTSPWIVSDRLDLVDGAFGVAVPVMDPEASPEWRVLLCAPSERPIETVVHKRPILARFEPCSRTWVLDCEEESVTRIVGDGGGQALLNGSPMYPIAMAGTHEPRTAAVVLDDESEGSSRHWLVQLDLSGSRPSPVKSSSIRADDVEVLDWDGEGALEFAWLRSSGLMGDRSEIQVTTMDGRHLAMHGIPDSTDLAWFRMRRGVGRPDALVGVAQYDGERRRQLIRLDPTGVRESAVPLGERGVLRHSLVLDADGDGSEELVLFACDNDVRYAREVQIWNADLELQARQSLQWRLPRSEEDPIVLDWDGDGVQDLLLANESGEAIVVSLRRDEGLVRNRARFLEGLSLLEAGSADAAHVAFEESGLGWTIQDRSSVPDISARLRSIAHRSDLARRWANRVDALHSPFDRLLVDLKRSTHWGPVRPDRQTELARALRAATARDAGELERIEDVLEHEDVDPSAGIWLRAAILEGVGSERWKRWSQLATELVAAGRPAAALTVHDKHLGTRTPASDLEDATSSEVELLQRVDGRLADEFELAREQRAECLHTLSQLRGLGRLLAAEVQILSSGPAISRRLSEGLRLGVEAALDPDIAGLLRDGDLVTSEVEAR